MEWAGGNVCTAAALSRLQWWLPAMVWLWRKADWGFAGEMCIRDSARWFHAICGSENVLSGARLWFPLFPCTTSWRAATISIAVRLHFRNHFQGFHAKLRLRIPHRAAYYFPPFLYTGRRLEYPANRGWWRSRAGAHHIRACSVHSQEAWWNRRKSAAHFCARDPCETDPGLSLIHI